jgi:hypothetical protein
MRFGGLYLAKLLICTGVEKEKVVSTTGSAGATHFQVEVWDDTNPNRWHQATIRRETILRPLKFDDPMAIKMGPHLASMPFRIEETWKDWNDPKTVGLDPLRARVQD